ncbi:MAG: serine/threonine-protein phosphatase [Polyangiaceae bacterium]|nr:serine/threonine-protein phosphatase [Polyangiaceae bacterium]
MENTESLELATTAPQATRPQARTPQVECFGLTDQGRVRGRNEDAYLMATLERALLVRGSSLPVGHWPHLSTGVGGTLLVVADGMGGLGGGDVASRVAVATIADYMVSYMPWTDQFESRAAPTNVSLPEIRAGLDRALHAGEEQVKGVGRGGAHPRMGTTVTMAYVLWPRLYVAHAGDSRCYLFREKQLHRLTRDHTLAEEAASAGLGPVQPASHLHNVLWNALGADTDVKPEITRYELRPGDQLLLCTDGLSKHVSDEELAHFLLESSVPQRICGELVKAANAAGGSDNITVVIARFR